MFVKNIQLACRFLLKHKEYTVVNIVGLTMSLVSVLFIGLYIADELSFDRFHSKADRIYRVIEHETSAEGSTSQLADVPLRVSMLKDQLSAIENAVKISFNGRANFYTPENDNKIYEPFILSDQSLLDIFDFKVIHGSRERALSKSHTLIITKTTAERLFGKADVVDYLINVDRDNQPFRITAVLEDFPGNSHLNFNIVLSFASVKNLDSFKEREANDWSSNNYATYFLTREGASIKELEKNITAIVNKNRDTKTPKTSFTLQPLKDIHFHSANIAGGFLQNPGEIYYLYIFGTVGIFILLIACINYINLSTSLSNTRGKEVGVKKVAGAARYNLVTQFITEANLITIISLLLALVVVNALIPAFNSFVGKQIPSLQLWGIKGLTVLTGFALLTGTVAGCYPAFYLSKFKPSQAIKGFSTAGKKSGTFRQGLVVFQFALSITLILATLIAHQQISFIRNKQLGFNKEQLVVLDINSGAVRRGYQVIKNEISKIPEVKNVSVSSRVPGEWKNLPQVGATVQGQEQIHQLYFMGVDDAFLHTFEIRLVAGRNFSDNIPSDSASFLINETAARELGFKDPLNENLTLESVNFAVNNSPLENPFKGKIIGVVKDFHFQSLHQKIHPLLIAFRNNPIHSIDYFSVRLMPGDWQSALKKMEKALQTVDAAHLIEYNFLDQRLEDFYRQDQKRGELFTAAAIVSIGLACLGLFSLVSFMTEQRTKEIGIRKALGATTAEIVGMLSSSYIRLVLFGFILAIPFSLWALDNWLQSFAYKIEIGWFTIAASCVISVLTAFITVGYKSVKAAMENPVKSLRNE